MTAYDEVDAVVLTRLPPGRHGLSRKHVADSQRRRLRRAIVDAVGKNGYAATTIADLNSLADVSKKTFYEHFKDKEECFLVAYEAFAHYLLKEMVAASRSTRSGGWLEGYRANTKRFLSLLATHPTRTRALMFGVLAAGPKVLARRRQILKSFVDMLRYVHAIARKEDSGIPDLPPELFEIIVYGVDELIRNYILEDRIKDLPDLADTITSSVEAAFKAGGRSGAARSGTSGRKAARAVKGRSIASARLEQ